MYLLLLYPKEPFQNRNKQLWGFDDYNLHIVYPFLNVDNKQ